MTAVVVVVVLELVVTAQDVDEELVAAAVVDDVTTAVVDAVLELVVGAQDVDEELVAAAEVDDDVGSTHNDADVAAEAVLYFPAGHSVHAADPFTSLKLPAAQAPHPPPSMTV
eukprot:GHVU01014247.1.p2 GENE.GHVU01014247.1~~GHVU01014247.1.p2  ORF type:complete len:113 (-),score=26.22 GHVU01014247.1:399-737(-)